MLHDEIADALVDVLKGIKVIAYKWSPKKIKPLCAVVEMPSIHRTEPDQAEDHLGATDWRFDFPVAFYTELTRDPRSNQAQVLKRVVEFVESIDALKPGPSELVLNEICTDVKVVSAEPFIEPTGQNRARVGYETHVSILTFQ